MKITIIELDTLSEEQVGLISTLADAGKKAYPPASAALSVLDKLGTSLLAGNSDDITFRYVMTLTSGLGNSDYSNPILSAGNYAFVKKKTAAGHQEKEFWDQLKFDNLSGRLVEKCTPEVEQKPTYAPTNRRDKNRKRIYELGDFNPCTIQGNGNYIDYRKNSYLIFQIQTGFPERTLDKVQLVSELINDINQHKDKDSLFIKKTIDELGNSLVRINTLEDINKAIVTLQRLKSDPINFSYEDFNITTQSLVDQYADIIDQRIKNCADPKTCNKSPSIIQLRQVTRKMRLLISSLDPTTNLDTALPVAIISQGLSTKKTPTRADIVNTLNTGYLTYFQSRQFESSFAAAASINNTYTNLVTVKEGLKDSEKAAFSLSIVTLQEEFIKDKETDIDYRKLINLKRDIKILAQHFKKYLYQLRHSTSQYHSLVCGVNTSPKICYNLASLAQYKKIGDLINNSDINSVLDAAKITIDFSTQVKLDTSFSITKINTLIKALGNSFQ